jgi:hypothetical protein
MCVKDPWATSLSNPGGSMFLLRAFFSSLRRCLGLLLTLVLEPRANAAGPRAW